MEMAAHTPCRTRTVSTVALATLQTFLLVALADAGKGPGTRVRTKKWHRHKKWHKMGDHPPKWHERGLIWFVIGFLLFLVVRPPAAALPDPARRRPSRGTRSARSRSGKNATRRPTRPRTRPR
jgi:hypothetical protein